MCEKLSSSCRRTFFC